MCVSCLGRRRRLGAVSSRPLRVASVAHARRCCPREVCWRTRALGFAYTGVRAGWQLRALGRRLSLVTTVVPHPDVCVAVEEGDVQPPEHPAWRAVLTLSHAGVRPVPTRLHTRRRLVSTWREDLARCVNLVSAELLLGRQCKVLWRWRQAPEAPCPWRGRSHEFDATPIAVDVAVVVRTADEPQSGAQNGVHVLLASSTSR